MTPDLTAEQIKQLRRRLHLTQKQLAERLSVARETLCRWERGVKPLPVFVERLKELANGRQ